GERLADEPRLELALEERKEHGLVEGGRERGRRVDESRELAGDVEAEQRLLFHLRRLNARPLEERADQDVRARDRSEIGAQRANERSGLRALGLGACELPIARDRLLDDEGVREALGHGRSRRTRRGLEIPRTLGGRRGHGGGLHRWVFTLRAQGGRIDGGTGRGRWGRCGALRACGTGRDEQDDGGESHRGEGRLAAERGQARGEAGAVRGHALTNHATRSTSTSSVAPNTYGYSGRTS